MNIDTWLLYLFAILLIAISPGTMAVLSMGHGIHYGKRRSLATALGSVIAALILMMASTAGLGALLNATQYGFIILKWCGAAYLLCLGVKLLLTPAKHKSFTLKQTQSNAHPIALFKQAFLVGISNPKDLLFLPRFFRNLLMLMRRKLHSWRYWQPHGPLSILAL